MSGAISGRKTRDVPEFAWTDAGMIAEKASEMRRLLKAEALAELSEPRILMDHGIQRALHSHNVQVDLG